MRQHSIPSIFIFYEVSAYTTLFETIVANTLDIWILDSVERNLDLFRIRLLPFLVYQKINLNEKTSRATEVTPRGRDCKTNTGLISKVQKEPNVLVLRAYLRRPANHQTSRQPRATRRTYT
jgi:hypothetical protein